MATEDHPLDYAEFEGIIPEGEYGGGTVMVWDYGTYKEGDKDPEDAIRRGEFEFKLNGNKLKGSWVLVRIRDRSWLLIKHRDRSATGKDITNEKPLSVFTRRTLAEIAEDEGGNVLKASRGDPRLVLRHRRIKRKIKKLPSAH